MKLVSFSIKNYRSITQTEKIKLSNLTVLVGPNNEGKSNMIRALMLGLDLLNNEMQLRQRLRPRYLRGRYYSRGDSSYSWERDFPIGLQKNNRSKEKTELTFEFSLNPKEILKFEDEIKSKLNGTIPITIILDPAGNTQLEINKKGRGFRIINSKKEQILSFILARFESHSIQAVRDTDESLKIIYRLIEQNLKELNSNKEYLIALEKIRQLQRPYFENISKKINDSLKSFIPSVKHVQIGLNMEDLGNLGYAREFDMKVDDGALTDIHLKGDGVQSLAAISLIKLSLEEKNKSNKETVLSIEEPEAHLHPKAIHSLKKILEEIAQKQQVIITTHSPLLVDLRKFDNNILVLNNKARPAKDLREVREVLGVRLSDNLQSSEMVLLLEGETEYIILEKILKDSSSFMKNAIENRRLVLVNIHGASKIGYNLNLYRDTFLIPVFFLLDSEKSNLDQIKNIQGSNLIRENEYKFILQHGLNEAEFEDLFDFKIYKDEVENFLGISLEKPAFTNSKEKWSVRLKNCAFEQGKPLNEDTLKKIKTLIVETLLKKDKDLLISKNKAFWESLIKNLEAGLNKNN